VLGTLCDVDKRAESLRRLIALYREYLRIGTDLERTDLYRQRIEEAEVELADIEHKSRRRKDDS